MARFTQHVRKYPVRAAYIMHSITPSSIK